MEDIMLVELRRRRQEKKVGRERLSSNLLFCLGEAIFTIDLMVIC